ncbi:MAG: translation initiation factor IF-2 [Nitrospirae bacterium]|nr:MAG: translation initiation factor IF-2 [Nitrospirota bacterium]
MLKMRIRELSKEINVPNKDIIRELEKMGITGKKPASNIEGELIEKIKEIFKKPEKEKKEKKIKEPAQAVEKKEKREKPRIPEKPVEEAKKQAEQFIKAEDIEDEDITLPDRFKKDLSGQKVEKLKSKSLQRAFQSIRKIEPKRVDFKSHKKKGKGKREEKKEEVKQASTAVPRKKAVKITEGTTVKEFAELIGVKVTDIIKKFMELGALVNINQPVDMDAAILVADSYGIKVEAASREEDSLEIQEVEDRPEDLKPRAPVVTVMGHVDHGKTSLLDAIRQTRVIETEAGGITQHIGAYKVSVKGKEIVFLDTPGHEAFTTMRARGAQVTDIVVLVVAADDGVMPQTVEAINHAKAAGVPIIVAVNKIDKPEANPQKVRNELAEHDIIPEEWGGKNIFVDISAKKHIGIDDLLEMIILQAEIMELKANPNRPARGVIIESRLDRGRGPVATVLVQNGTLRVGDPFVTELTYGKVRALIDEHGKRIKEATPSTPIEVIGFEEVPQAGDHFVVVENERRAKEIAHARQHKARLAELARQKKVRLDDIYRQIQEGEIKMLNVIIKGDVQGSVEAMKGALEKIKHPEVQVKVIHTGVGGINESDVMLAAASNAIIIGFNVRPEPKASQAAEREGIDIRLYRVIYEAIEDVKKALEGLLEPELVEKVIGRAEVRATFPVSRLGTIAGCYVLEGVIQRASDGIRVIRDNIVIYEGKIASLKRFKEDVREVQAGYECGILIENFNDIKVGDILENFVIEKVAQKLGV